jgi:Mn-dependent DtxR family transcriptional regulator
MEHSIPDHILERLVRFAEYTETCPEFNARWLESADGYFCKAQGDIQRCGKCRLIE